jgi:chromosomal replication initiation ATPase DnaA
LPEHRARVRSAAAIAASARRRAGLKSAASFEALGDLIFGEEEIAQARSFVAAAGSGQPLVIHGGSISQRRALLNAIGNALLGDHPDLKLKRVTLCEYLDQMLSANTKRRDGDFMRRYLCLDAALVEGIEGFTLDEELEDALFLTMGTLAERGCWVAMTCAGDPVALEFKSRYARNLMTFATRLRLRTGWPS